MSGTAFLDRHVYVSDRGDDDEDPTAVPDIADADRRFTELEQAFRRMMEDRFLDGLVRRFEKLFPDHSAEVEDVLFEEVVKLAEATGAPPRNVRAVLTWRLRKRMLDVAKRRTSEVWEDDSVERDTPERQAIRKEMFDQLKALLDAWENRTMALVARLTLEAAYYDEALEVDDIKEFVADQLGHELTTVNIWKLRSRGLKRLASEVVGLLGEYAEGWEATTAADHDDADDTDDTDDTDDEANSPVHGAEEE